MGPFALGGVQGKKKADPAGSATMREGAKIGVIIPVLNEEEGIQKVIPAIPDWVDEVVVVDNGSTDRTSAVARSLGAQVLFEPRRGYGSACLAGIATLKDVDVVVFLDGDFSDYPEEMARLVDPILRGEADMVIGSRVLGKREKGALTLQARFGNWLACLLIQAFWKVAYTDLGPFRAIRFYGLQRLEMGDPDYGWTVEMQVKGAIRGLKSLEVPVSYRRRIGRSKVSGTVKGVVFAGAKILYTIFKCRAPGFF
jgi:glycosyltransferase involved in cell wall biosynthesis